MNGFFPEGWNTQATDSKKTFTPAFLADAKEKQTVLESTVTMCDASHNLIVDLGTVKGIIPREEGAIGIADGSTRDIALISRVGKPVCFVVSSSLTPQGAGAMPRAHNRISRHRRYYKR